MEIYTTYKDRVFRLLFRDKKRLLELYNALNNTYYDNEEELQVTTLENAIFIKMTIRTEGEGNSHVDLRIQ